MTIVSKIYLMLLLVWSSAASSTADLPPLRLRDPGRSPQMRIREYAFKDYRAIGIRHSVPCRIRYVDRYFGYLDDAAYYRAGKMPFQSVCYDASVEDVLVDAPVRYDENRKQWVRYIGKELMRWDMGDGLSPETVKSIDESIHVYTLNNINSQGFAYTVDPWTGDEAARTRRLDYCIFRSTVALCGHGEVGTLVDGPKGDLTPYVLQILRSIEFLPDAPPVPAASAPDSSAPSQTRTTSKQ